MPDSYVTSATIKGDELTFDVKVDDFKPNSVIEISGQATQIGGAFAPISEVKTVPAEPTVPVDPEIDGDTGHYYVSVTATKMGEYLFKKDQDVTVFVRVSRVWVTVLGPQGQAATTKDEGQDAGDGTIWDQVRKEAELEDGNSAQGGNGQ